MGAFVNKKVLVKKSFIILSGVCTFFGIALNSVAMGTNYWVVANGCFVNNTLCSDQSSLAVNYGLFKGMKSLDTGLSPTKYQLTVFCPTGEGICMLSCGANTDEQKSEFNYLRNGAPIFNCVPSSKSALTVSSLLLRDNIPASDDQFMNFGSWITTVIFLSLTLAFQVIACGLCALNSADSVPVEVWLGPMGIYIANAAAGLTGLITLSIWGDLVSRHLSNEISIQETILNSWKTTTTNLGYSYWLVFGALVLSIVSCVFIRFRNVPKKHYNKEGGPMEVNAAPNSGGVILLY